MKRYYDKRDKDWKLIEQRRSGGKKERRCVNVCVVVCVVVCMHVCGVCVRESTCECVFIDC